MPDFDQYSNPSQELNCSPRDYDQTPQEMFSSEMLVSRRDLYDSGFRRDLVSDIESDKRLSLTTKRALIAVIKASFDKTVVLANLKNPDLVCIDLDIILNQARAGYSPADLSVNFSPVATYEDLIRQNFTFYISRATGKDRERRLQNLMESRSEQSVHQELSRPEQKRGFNLPFFGGKK